MTPAITAANKAGVQVRVLRYEHDPAAASYGTEAAEKLGLPADRVFKTLIAHAVPGGREALAVAMVPVSGSLDLKKLAAALGSKKAEMADADAAERATGYQVGGISPLGQKKRLATVLDESALRFETIYVSAGRRGLQIEIAPADLLKLTGGRTAPISAP